MKCIRTMMRRPHSILWRRLSPLSGARVNLCVLWVGRQLSLLGGREPIATTQCDRRRATIDSSAYARSPATPVDHPRLKH